MNLPGDREELRQRWEAGERFGFYFFYGHKRPATGVDASCFSQWFEAGFDIDGTLYKTAEHRATWVASPKTLIGRSRVQ